MGVDEEILNLAKRIQALSEPPGNQDQAHWRLVKIQDAANALIPRLEYQFNNKTTLPGG
jgi:hypothetical protein